MNKIFFLLFLTLLSPIAYAQFGNTGVQMHGQAGEYKVLVDVQPPKVTPGKGKIYVQVETLGIVRVEARTLNFPIPNSDSTDYKKLRDVKKQAGQFQGEVQFTTSGSTAIQLKLVGSKGVGEITIPVKVNRGQENSSIILNIGLLLLGILLLTLVTTPNFSFCEKKRYQGIALGVLGLAFMLYGTSFMWKNHKSEDNYPLRGNSSVIIGDSLSVLQIKLDTTHGVSQKKGKSIHMLIPDHGKLMHAFLLRTPTLDAFAHLHPERKDSTTFEANLPQLPPGKYLVYADIVFQNGISETITDTLIIGNLGSKREANSEYTEDTFVITDPINAPGNASADADIIICGKPGTKTVFKDGSYAVWAGRPDQALEAGRAYNLDFEIYNPDGSACLPEPYLGIMGHLVVVKSDGSVYNHLHPSGTFPAVTERLLKNGMAHTKLTGTAFRDSVDQHLALLKGKSVLEREEFLMTEMGMYDLGENGMVGMDHGSLISFPFTFPKEGRYRIFLQVKRNEKVMTGAFDVKVKKGALQL